MPDQTTPDYVDRVYSALRDNLEGFNKTPEQFRFALQDKGYAKKVYTALSENLDGFAKPEKEFYQAITPVHAPIHTDTVPFSLNNNPAVHTPPQGQQPVIPAIKHAPKTFGASFFNDMMDNYYYKKVAENMNSGIVGAERMFADLPFIGKETAQSIKDHADKGQFANSTNKWNKDETVSAIYDYLKGKGVNPNDNAQVAAYLSRHNSPDDQRILDYMGGDKFIKDQHERGFNFEEVKHGKNILSNMGGGALNMLTLAPMMTVPSSFVTDGYNRVSQELDANPETKDLPGYQKHVMGLIGGGVNALAGKIKLPFSKAVSEKMLPYLTKAVMDKIVQSGAKEITPQVISAAMKDVAVPALQRVKRFGISALKDVAHNSAVGAALVTGHTANHALANAFTGKQVYDVSPGQFANDLGATMSEFALSTVPGATLNHGFELFPRSARNYVKDKVASAENDGDIQLLKNQVMLEGKDMGFSEDQLAKAGDLVDTYYELKKKLPAMDRQTTGKVLGLMDQRKELQGKIRQIEDQKNNTDDLFKGDVDRELSSAKVNLESLEDKIRSTANNHELKFEERDGHYYKINPDTKDELPISKERYDFEKFMEDQQKSTQQKAVETATEHIDNLIKENDIQPSATGSDHSAQPHAAAEVEPASVETRPEGNTATQPNKPDGAGEVSEPTHKTPDVDGLIRKALKAAPGETIEANGQVFKVLESEQSANRLNGSAKLVRLVDGKPDEETGTIEITQKSDSRNADRIHDNQNEIKSATRLPDGRYSFGQGIRTSSNIEPLIESLTPKENADTPQPAQTPDGTVAEEPAGSQPSATGANQGAPAAQFPEGSWSQRFSAIDESNRTGEVEKEVVKAKEVIKQLKDTAKVNIKAEAVIKRIKELAENKLISKEEADRQVEELRRYQDQKIGHLMENGEKKSADASGAERALSESTGIEPEKLLSEDGEPDMDAVAKSAAKAENPEKVFEAVNQHAEAMGIEHKSLIERAIDWTNEQLEEEKGKRGKKSSNLYTTPIPPEVGREIGILALKALRETLKATQSFTKAFQAAMDRGKKESLDKNALDEMRKWLHSTFASINAGHVRDFIKEEKLTRETQKKLAKALDRVRARSKAFLKDNAKEAEFKAAKKELSEMLKDFKSKASAMKLKFTPADLARMTRVAAAATTPHQVLKLIPELQKTFAKQENNKLVSDTESLSRKAAKIARSMKTSAAEREVFSRVSKIIPSELTKPDGSRDLRSISKLKRALEAIAESHKDVNIAKGEEGDYELVNQGKANHDYLNTVADELGGIAQAHRDREQEAQAQDLLDELEADGKIDTSGLMPSELTLLKQSIKDGTLPQLAAERENQRLSDIAERIDKAENKSELLKSAVEDLVKDALDNSDIGDHTELRKQFKELLSGGIKVDELSNSELVRLHRVLSRMAENGDITTIRDAYVIPAREAAVSRVRGIMDGKGATLGKFWAGMHLPHVLAKIIPNEKKLAEFTHATFISDWDRGYNIAKNKANEVSEGALKLLAKASGKDSESIEAGFGSMRRGVIAYLLQHYGGTPEEINQHFNDVSIKNVFQSLKYLSESPEDKELKNQAEHLQDILEQMFDDDTLHHIQSGGRLNYEDFVRHMEKQYAPDMTVIKHWRDAFNEHKEQLADAELMLKGNVADYGIENYTSTSVKDAGERSRNEIQSLIDDYRNPGTIGKKSAGSTISRERQPLKSGYLDFDFDAVQPQRFMENMLEIHTLGERYKLQALMDDPRFQQAVFPDSRQSMDRFYKRILETEQARRGANTMMGTQGGRIATKILDGLQKLGAVYQLGSVTQVLKQVPSVMVNTAVNLGTEAPLLFGATADVLSGKAEEFLKQSSVSMRHENKVTFTSTMQAQERGNHLKAFSRAIIAEMNKHGLEVLPQNLRDKMLEYVMMPLGRSDQAIAEASLLAYYKKYLKDQGRDVSAIDWSDEAQNPNKEALAYAEHMVDRTQNVSDKTKVAGWLKPKDLWGKLGAFMAAPYSSFNLNQKMRSAGDFNKMINGGDMETRMQGARDFAATVAESIMFNLSKAYAIKLIGSGMGQVFNSSFAGGHNEDDDKRERELMNEGAAGEIAGNSFQDVAFSGLGSITSDVLSYGINWGATQLMGQQPYISPTTGNVKMVDRQPLFTTLGKEAPSAADKARNIMGGFAPAAELILRNGERFSDYIHGYKEVANNLTGEKRLVPMTDYEKSMTKLMMIKDAIAVTTGAQDADLINRPAEKEYTKLMNDLKLGYFDGFKRLIQAQHYHEGKFSLGKLGTTAKEVDQNRQVSDQARRASLLDKDYAYYKANEKELVLPMLLHNEMATSPHITKDDRELFERVGKGILKAINSGEAYRLPKEQADQLITHFKDLLLRKANGDANKAMDAALESVQGLTSDLPEEDQRGIVDGIRSAIEKSQAELSQKRTEQQIENQ